MDIFIKGGPVMYFILICSITAIAIFINKIIHLHRAQIDVQEFMAGLRNELLGKRITEAVSICDETPGPVASVLKAGIIHYEEGKIGMETSMEKVSVYEIARMEKGIAGLATIAVISPLFGFLGTVLGLINTFQKMSGQGGLILTPDLASGMWQAMFTTAFGLAVAIPTYVAYNYFVSRINRITKDMQAAGEELVGILGVE